MRIIAVANQKGGCGKTTTAINLAACLGVKGARVLLIDMDPQGHSSLGLGVSSDDIPGLYEVFSLEKTLAEVILPDVCNGVDLIPATISLAAVEQQRLEIPQREQQLAIHLRQYGERHDYVIIDCPPALGVLSFNALRAANEVIIPIEMSLFAMNGIERLHDTINLLQKKYDIEIPIRVLPTLVDKRTKLCRRFLRQIWEKFAEEVYPLMVQQTVRLKEAACAGKPIIEFDPLCLAADAYMRLADEVLLNDESAKADIYPASTDTAAAQEPRQNPVIPTPELSSPGPEQQVILRLQGYAGKNVKVAGDFNDWQPDYNVETRTIDDTLEKVITASPGFYQYRLIVDGSWQEDPYNPIKVPNQVGGHNSLLRIRNHAVTI